MNSIQDVHERKRGSNGGCLILEGTYYIKKLKRGTYSRDHLTDEIPYLLDCILGGCDVGLKCGTLQSLSCSTVKLHVVLVGKYLQTKRKRYLRFFAKVG